MSTTRLFATALLPALFTPVLRAQINTTLLQNWKRTSTASAYSDVWGYTAPDGKEFAFIGDSAGISILDATNPGSVKSLGFYAVSASSYAWRDYTNYGKYVYEVSEHHRGLRVFEMQSNGTPKDHGFVQTSTIASAHNIRCDTGTGLLYVCGGNNRGLAIFDAKAAPTNPTFLAVWNTYYVHDACIRRGKAYACTGSSYVTKILDVTNPKSLKEIGSCPTTPGYNHSAWVSEDDKILCINNEIARNGVQPHMQVWDVSNPAKPSHVGTFHPASNAISHNVFVIGRTAFLSYYIHGLQVVDLADPTKPAQLAEYRTSTITSVGYYGTWGVYPFQDSGVIYLSDMQNGFFAVRVDCGHMNRFGAGTAGTTGVPRARFDGATPKVNAAKLRLEVEDLEASQSFWLVASAKAGSGAVLGANINVDLSTAVIVGPLGADAQGRASLATPIPNDTSLGNAKVYLQIFSKRANGTLTSSRGMWAGICK